MNFSLGTSYEMHLQNITSANYRSQRKMPWDLTLNTPWEVSKKLRGEKLFNVGILPPIPGNKTELNKTGFAGLDDTASDAFKSAGIALRSSSDTALARASVVGEESSLQKVDLLDSQAVWLMGDL